MYKMSKIKNMYKLFTYAEFFTNIKKTFILSFTVNFPYCIFI